MKTIILAVLTTVTSEQRYRCHSSSSMLVTPFHTHTFQNLISGFMLDQKMRINTLYSIYHIVQSDFFLVPKLFVHSKIIYVLAKL